MAITSIDQNLPIIKPEFRTERVQELIVKCWGARTASEWRQSQTVMLAILKISGGDFFDDIFFLHEIADERQTMAWNEENAIYLKAGPV